MNGMCINPAKSDEIKDLRVVTPNPNIPWVDIDSDGDHFEKFVAVASGPAKVVASNWPWQALSTFNVTCLKLDRDILLDPYPFQDPQKQAEYINKNSTRVSAIIPTRNVIKRSILQRQIIQRQLDPIPPADFTRAS